jgi:hypothetical protein
VACGTHGILPRKAVQKMKPFYSHKCRMPKSKKCRVEKKLTAKKNQAWCWPGLRLGLTFLFSQAYTEKQASVQQHFRPNTC